MILQQDDDSGECADADPSPQRLLPGTGAVIGKLTAVGEVESVGSSPGPAVG